MIPNPVRPHDGDRSGYADLQAIGLGPLHTALGNQTQILEPPFKEFPAFLACRMATALLLFRNPAQENMPRDRIAADCRERAFGLRNLAS